jgi:hypothetical protein
LGGVTLWSQFGTKCPKCGYRKITTLTIPSSKVIGKEFSFECHGCGTPYSFKTEDKNVYNCDPTVPYWEANINKILLGRS